jgi:hypothetical protein
MPEGPEAEAKVSCSRCGVQVRERELEECFVCHVLCCPFCVVHDFGRAFCSSRCRGFFFWGDGEHDDQVD